VAKKDQPSNPAHKIDSAAFHDAELQSERLRIFGVLSVVAIFIMVTVVRVFVIRTVSTTTPWAWQFGLAASIIIYEVWMLSRVNLALRSERSLPAGF